VRLENLALWQVWVVGGLGATCQCAKCVSAKKILCGGLFYFFLCRSVSFFRRWISGVRLSCHCH